MRTAYRITGRRSIIEINGRNLLDSYTPSELSMIKKETGSCPEDFTSPIAKKRNLHFYVFVSDQIPE